MKRTLLFALRHLLMATWALYGLVTSQGGDTSKGLIFLKATEGASLRNSFKKFSSTEMGKSILRERRQLVDVLSDSNWLQRLEPNSLGAVYRDFLQAEHLTVEGLKQLMVAPWNRILTPDEILYEERIFAQHDLWHVVLGHQPTRFGELCLAAFTVAQLNHLGLKFLVLSGAASFACAHPTKGVPAAVIESWRAGKKAEWLYGVDWEALLPLPLEKVRQRLRIPEPVAYKKAAASIDAIA